MTYVVSSHNLANGPESKTTSCFVELAVWAVRRYIDFYTVLWVVTLYWPVCGVHELAGEWRTYFGYDVFETDLHVNLSLIFALHYTKQS